MCKFTYHSANQVIDNWRRCYIKTKAVARLKSIVARLLSGVTEYFNAGVILLGADKTSKRGISSGVTEHFMLFQRARIRVGEIPSGVGKT